MSTARLRLRLERNLKRFCPAVLLLSVVAAELFAQSSLSPSPGFDAASIKVRIETDGASRLQPLPLGLRATNVTIRTCIEWAWRLRSYQVVFTSSGASRDNTRYDIVARTSSPVSVAQLQLMLQRLLTERFDLAEHSETRELPVFALVVAKGGPKQLRDAEPTEETRLELDPTSTNDGQRWIFHNSPIASLAGLVSNGLTRPLIDKSGLTGKFDFSVTLPVWDRASDTLEEHAISDVFPAIQRQLGLKIEAQKSPVDVLVVDRFARAPSDN